MELLTKSNISTAGENQPGAGVLEKAMSLLNIVSGAKAAMTFTELLRHSGLPKATLHRILST
ncbi:MAG: IclR helix-turn-helix domain, partial [Pseudomonadota bacterium]